MATKKPTKTVPSDKQPAAKLLHSSMFLGVTDLAIEAHKLQEIAELLWLPRSLSEEDQDVRILRALELYESIQPADGLEAMLAAQMVGAHSAALECLKRAAISEQTFESRDMALKHAQKLMLLYAQQLAALDKHRGKGQQKVTVEHVHVAPGGQAIVGNVEVRSKSAPPPKIEQALNITPTPADAKVTARIKKR